MCLANVDISTPTVAYTHSCNLSLGYSPNRYCWEKTFPRQTQNLFWFRPSQEVRSTTLKIKLQVHRWVQCKTVTWGKCNMPCYNKQRLCQWIIKLNYTNQDKGKEAYTRLNTWSHLVPCTPTAVGGRGWGGGWREVVYYDDPIPWNPMNKNCMHGCNPILPGRQQTCYHWPRQGHGSVLLVHEWRFHTLRSC